MTTLAKYYTREEWFMAAVARMSPWFEAEGHPLPTVQVSVGFGKWTWNASYLGVCWNSSVTSDKSRQIFIYPHKNGSVEVLDTLIHELVHAALPDKVHHGAPFRKLATSLGLVGKMTHASAGPELRERLQGMVMEIGPYPHPKFDPGLGSGRKKQSTRMIKCECQDCGYIARTSSRWISELGPPLCPCNEQSMEVVK